jgi:hypothetical protein
MTLTEEDEALAEESAGEVIDSEEDEDAGEMTRERVA